MASNWLSELSVRLLAGETMATAGQAAFPIGLSAHVLLPVSPKPSGQAVIVMRCRCGGLFHNYGRVDRYGDDHITCMTCGSHPPATPANNKIRIYPETFPIPDIRTVELEVVPPVYKGMRISPKPAKLSVSYEIPKGKLLGKYAFVLSVDGWPARWKGSSSDGEDGS